MSNWRVVHFSTGSTGGAAIAAKSLNQALKSHEIDSQIFFLSNPGRDIARTRLLKRSLSEAFISRIYSLFTSVVSKSVLFTTYSSRLSSLNRLVFKLDPNTTILHFHNWFNMGNSSQFNELEKRGYKLVFTLHDERFYTGGCHYALACEKFQSNCDQCPLILEILSFAPRAALEKTYEDMNNSQATFIAPSKWIQERALSSKLLRNSNVVHIPNYISIPEREEIPAESTHSSDLSIILGVASMNPFDPIKGGELVKEISKCQSGFKLIFLKDYADADLFWKSIDYLFAPSLIDNSPNVIHESKLRGIPIIAMSVGGITELMGEQDIQLKDCTYNSFLHAIAGARKESNTKIRVAVRAELEDYRKNSIKLHVEEYEKLFAN